MEWEVEFFTLLTLHWWEQRNMATLPARDAGKSRLWLAGYVPIYNVLLWKKRENSERASSSLLHSYHVVGTVPMGDNAHQQGSPRTQRSGLL